MCLGIGVSKKRIQQEVRPSMMCHFSCKNQELCKHTHVIHHQTSARHACNDFTIIWKQRHLKQESVKMDEELIEWWEIALNLNVDFNGEVTCGKMHEKSLTPTSQPLNSNFEAKKVSSAKIARFFRTKTKMLFFFWSRLTHFF